MSRSLGVALLRIGLAGAILFWKWQSPHRWTWEWLSVPAAMALCLWIEQETKSEDTP